MMNRDLYKDRIKEATDRLVKSEPAGGKYGHGQAGMAHQTNERMTGIRPRLKPPVTEFIADPLPLGLSTSIGPMRAARRTGK